MAKPETDPAREERIENEIVVDAYDEYERATGWHCYLTDKITFPFTARCVAKRKKSPLKVNQEVEVTGMAPQEDKPDRDMYVLIRWDEEELAVPLSQLEPIEADEETVEAVGDWHYWVEMGYEF
jgi:hypothetical protein